MSSFSPKRGTYMWASLPPRNHCTNIPTIDLGALQKSPSLPALPCLALPCPAVSLILLNFFHLPPSLSEIQKKEKREDKLNDALKIYPTTYLRVPCLSMTSTSKITQSLTEPEPEPSRLTSNHLVPIGHRSPEPHRPPHPKRFTQTCPSPSHGGCDVERDAFLVRANR